MDFQQIRDFVNPAVAQATGIEPVENLSMPVPVAYVPVQLVIDGALSLTSENPVQNKVIAVAIQQLDGRITAIEGQFSEGVTEAVNNWLAAHPEATTTVQDGAISYAKLDANLKGKADQIEYFHPIINSIITSGLGVPYQYSLKAGKKYRFVNTSSTGYVSCYLSPDGTTNAFLTFSNLVPNGVVFVTPAEDYEYIRVYRGAADTSIQLYVTEGEYVDALTGASGLGNPQYNTLGEAIRGQINSIVSMMATGVEIVVGTGGQYTSILDALVACDENSIIHVKKGTYDIIEEYKQKYGETYWDDYSGYLNSQNKFDRGLWLKNGVKIFFDQNAIVTFNYTGNNNSVKGNFSPFATCGNCEINGLNLSFSGCRYAIHDDFFEVDGTETFKNCIFSGQSNNGDTIGAGLGRSNLIIIDSCLFIGNQNPETRGGDISYHNNGYSSNSKSKIIVKDCYGENTVKFKWYGTNTEVSECIVCGCQFKSIDCVPHSVTPNETVNMHLTKWNCVETGT